MSALNSVLADLHDESDDLDRLVSVLPVADWATQTPAPGWTISHQVAHLAWTDHVSRLAITDPVAFAEVLAQALEDPGGFADAGANEGAALSPGELLARWRSGRAALAVALAEVPDDARIQWFGTRMSATTMATARIMETWAHGQDVADALAVNREPTARIKHVTWLAVRTRDFAFQVHGLTPPAEPFRVELTAPSGELWEFGPPGAAERVSGPAVDLCLLATQRRHRNDLALVAAGANADKWLDIAQAFAGLPGAGRAPTGA
ncbi:MAG TPA: TIGR03084 family metal-binding protein [Candidatus Limnocylindrales bacterium]|nr:TIGR03084 family metal-binding protein [Candidatus Limnocylindrales bacterium]